MKIRALRESDVFFLTEFTKEIVKEKAPINTIKFDYLKEIRYFLDTINRMKNRRSIVIVAEDNGKIVGSCGIRRWGGRSNRVGELGIAVLKKYRGRGIGKRLMRKAMAEAKKIGIKIIVLGVIKGNKPAINLYKKFGFIEFGVLPKSIRYHGMKDLIYMYKFLK